MPFEDENFTFTQTGFVKWWCKEVSPVLPQLTVTPVQQMHSE
jgi:hypothetical protein